MVVLQVSYVSVSIERNFKTGLNYDALGDIQYVNDDS